MIRDLMKTNCYDIGNTIVIMGTCLQRMQGEAYRELTKISDDILELCLEVNHVNMAITKIIGMLCRVKVNKIVFATVDKSPHCIQMHYIENEIAKAMDIRNIEIIHYVAVDNKLVEISKDTISASKTLAKLEENIINKNIILIDGGKSE